LQACANILQPAGKKLQAGAEYLQAHAKRLLRTPETLHYYIAALPV
jgi:hypothetical protein